MVVTFLTFGMARPLVKLCFSLLIKMTSWLTLCLSVHAFRNKIVRFEVKLDAKIFSPQNGIRCGP